MTTNRLNCDVRTNTDTFFIKWQFILLWHMLSRSLLCIHDRMPAVSQCPQIAFIVNIMYFIFAQLRASVYMWLKQCEYDSQSTECTHVCMVVMSIRFCILPLVESDDGPSAVRILVTHIFDELSLWVSFRICRFDSIHHSAALLMFTFDGCYPAPSMLTCVQFVSVHKWVIVYSWNAAPSTKLDLELDSFSQWIESCN